MEKKKSWKGYPSEDLFQLGVEGFRFLRKGDKLYFFDSDRGVENPTLIELVECNPSKRKGVIKFLDNYSGRDNRKYKEGERLEVNRINQIDNLYWNSIRPFDASRIREYIEEYIEFRSRFKPLRQR